MSSEEFEFLLNAIAPKVNKILQCEKLSLLLKN